MTTPHEPDGPGHPRPYPYVPPETLPPHVPDRPEVRPPTPAVLDPRDDVRSRALDRLFARRTVFVDRALDRETTSLIAAQLMALDTDDDGTGHPAGGEPAPVTLVVNSPGGPVDAVAAVLDTIDLMAGPVETRCIGQATGRAAVLVAAGTGRRRAGAGARFRLRLPDVELTGSTTRLGDEVAGHRQAVDLLVDRLAAATGQDRGFVARDIERGRPLSAADAVSYGLVDEVTPGGPA